MCCFGRCAIINMCTEVVQQTDENENGKRKMEKIASLNRTGPLGASLNPRARKYAISQRMYKKMTHNQKLTHTKT